MARCSLETKTMTKEKMTMSRLSEEQLGAMRDAAQARAWLHADARRAFDSSQSRYEWEYDETVVAVCEAFGITGNELDALGEFTYAKGWESRKPSKS
jgi:hypothetical protein